jgi:hypothetical protein
MHWGGVGGAGRVGEGGAARSGVDGCCRRVVVVADVVVVVVVAAVVAVAAVVVVFVVVVACQSGRGGGRWASSCEGATLAFFRLRVACVCVYMCSPRLAAYVALSSHSLSLSCSVVCKLSAYIRVCACVFACVM